MLKKAWRKHKREIKETETPHQKRIRCLAKKDFKARNSYLKAKTNVSDNFPHFVWHKKLEKEGKLNLSRKQLEKEQSEKMIYMAKELEDYKMSKALRNRQYTERTNTFELIQREKDSAYHAEWENSDEHFQLEQATMRMKLRLANGRAKPIDLLWNYIVSVNLDGTSSMELEHPSKYIENMSADDFDDLLYDIEVVKTLEKGTNMDFWEDLTVLIQDQQTDKLKLLADEESRYRMEGAVGEEIMQRVRAVIEGKQASDLRTMEKLVTDKLKGGEGVDIGFWEILSKRLKVAIARASLDERHGTLIQNDPNIITDVKEECPSVESEDIPSAQDEYETGGYSPVLMSLDQDVPPNVLDEDEDALKLSGARLQVQKMAQMMLDREQEFDMVAREGMNSEESVLDTQVDLGRQEIMWMDKYKPRKPRFFNRVHMGFEWNRYNQTHYDPDNPPPKIVQGYKFNVYYPDLIDKSKIPSFDLKSCDDGEYYIVRISAGPPYEDIAFKIIDRDWELSWKYGYRCQFQNDIFQLWFNLRKERYRR